MVRSFLLMLMFQAFMAIANGPTEFVFRSQNGDALNQTQLRHMAIRLFKNQPTTPATSMDDEYRPQMTGTADSTVNDRPKSVRHLDPLSFLNIWTVLENAAASGGVKLDIQGRMNMVEGALLTAIAQAFPASLSPTVCLVGFQAGHSSIVWLESGPTVRVVVFDTFRHRYQLGSKVCVVAVYCMH